MHPNRMQPDEQVRAYRRYDDAFSKSLLKGDSRKSKEENIKELGF